MLVPIRLDRRRAAPAAPTSPALLRGLVRRPRRTAAAAAPAEPASALAERLAGLDAEARAELLLSTVRGTAARVLGHTGDRRGRRPTGPSATSASTP